MISNKTSFLSQLCSYILVLSPFGPLYCYAPSPLSHSINMGLRLRRVGLPREAFLASAPALCPSPLSRCALAVHCVCFLPEIVIICYQSCLFTDFCQSLARSSLIKKLSKKRLLGRLPSYSLSCMFEAISKHFITGHVVMSFHLVYMIECSPWLWTPVCLVYSVPSASHNASHAQISTE